MVFGIFQVVIKYFLQSFIFGFWFYLRFYCSLGAGKSGHFDKCAPCRVRDEAFICAIWLWSCLCWWWFEFQMSRGTIGPAQAGHRGECKGVVVSVAIGKRFDAAHSKRKDEDSYRRPWTGMILPSMKSLGSQKVMSAASAGEVRTGRGSVWTTRSSRAVQWRRQTVRQSNKKVIHRMDE